MFFGFRTFLVCGSPGNVPYSWTNKNEEPEQIQAWQGIECLNIFRSFSTAQVVYSTARVVSTFNFLTLFRCWNCESFHVFPFRTWLCRIFFFLACTLIVAVRSLNKTFLYSVICFILGSVGGGGGGFYVVWKRRGCFQRLFDWFEELEWSRYRK